jgi:hypothetical protein
LYITDEHIILPQKGFFNRKIAGFNRAKAFSFIRTNLPKKLNLTRIYFVKTPVGRPAGLQNIWGRLPP